MAAQVQQCFRRYEKKYFLTPAQKAALEEAMKEYMRPDVYSKYTICNIYYDTDDFSLIRSSLEHPLYKEKLRLRSYGVPGDADRVFVEIKKKFDGVVYKRRETMSAAGAVDYLDGKRLPRRDSQIFHELDWFQNIHRTKPKVFIAYEREAYAGRENPELRITFDTNLRWRATDVDLRCGDYGAPILSNDTILMEIKIPGAAPLWLSRLLSELRIFPTSFSKIGACYRENLAKPYIISRKEEAHHCA